MAAPKENKNAEKWQLEDARDLFLSCIATAQDKDGDDNDFIGEVAQANGTYITQLHDLKDKFPELERLYTTIKRHCEANCFRNGKKSKIVPSMAIMNLKSNHGWTDRSETVNEHKGEIKITREVIK